MHKQKQPRSLTSATLMGESAVLDEDAVDTELLALCSGKFETQSESLLPPLRPSLSHQTSDSSSIQGVRELLGLKQQRTTSGLGKLLGTAGLTSEDTEKSMLGSSDMSEVLGLCSGVFPTTQTQQRDQGDSVMKFTKFGKNVKKNHHHPSLDHNGSSSESEGDGEGGRLLSWAQRQRRLTDMLARGGNRDEEDDVMPTLTRKRKRGRPKPKATKEYVNIAG